MDWRSKTLKWTVILCSEKQTVHRNQGSW
jgi:hypothetical protein